VEKSPKLLLLLVVALLLAGCSGNELSPSTMQMVKLWISILGSKRQEEDKNKKKRDIF